MKIGCTFSDAIFDASRRKSQNILAQNFLKLLFIASFIFLSKTTGICRCRCGQHSRSFVSSLADKEQNEKRVNKLFDLKVFENQKHVNREFLFTRFVLVLRLSAYED